IHAEGHTGKHANRRHSYGTGWPGSEYRPFQTSAVPSWPGTSHRSLHSSDRHCTPAVAVPLRPRWHSALWRRRPDPGRLESESQAAAWLASVLLVALNAALAALVPAIRPKAVPMDIPIPAV